ncbi:MAG TPA: hypothetical protein V6C88_12010 [Chroococcidiopsis sp.]
MSHSFSLAAMSPSLKWLTTAVLTLPLILGVIALTTHEPVSGGVALLLIAVCGGVWLWCRPYRFVVADDDLKMVFPGWQRTVPIGSISRVRCISKETFYQEFGWAMRIGVGGLWGGFGWLWTSKQGLIEFYISQLDEFVLVERSHGRSLLITPEHPIRFVEVVQNLLTHSA